MKRPSSGVVVKPIWLLMMTWIVPPVRHPGSSERSSVSKTMPWPVKEASPWNEHGDGLGAFVVVARLLFAADDAFHDRIDQLQVAGVGAEADVDRVPLAGGAVVGVAEVVFHVAVAVGLPADGGSSNSLNMTS